MTIICVVHMMHGSGGGLAENAEMMVELQTTQSCDLLKVFTVRITTMSARLRPLGCLSHGHIDLIFDDPPRSMTIETE